MSSTRDQDLHAPRAPKAGADLRAARERVGWSLSEMADGLRIRYQYLEALEDGRINEVPGNSWHALGFMRTTRRRSDWIPMRSRVASEQRPPR